KVALHCAPTPLKAVEGSPGDPSGSASIILLPSFLPKYKNFSGCKNLAINVR
ncbi:unnamed protein product, partial [Acanthoscelides obtectus]